MGGRDFGSIGVLNVTIHRSPTKVFFCRIGAAARWCWNKLWWSEYTSGWFPTVFSWIFDVSILDQLRERNVFSAGSGMWVCAGAASLGLEGA